MITEDRVRLGFEFGEVPFLSDGEFVYTNRAYPGEGDHEWMMRALSAKIMRPGSGYEVVSVTFNFDLEMLGYWCTDIKLGRTTN